MTAGWGLAVFARRRRVWIVAGGRRACFSRVYHRSAKSPEIAPRRECGEFLALPPVCGSHCFAQPEVALATLAYLRLPSVHASGVREKMAKHQTAVYDRRLYGFTGGLSGLVLLTHAVDRQSWEFSEPMLSSSFTVSGCNN